MNDFADYASAGAHKLLSSNRDFYVQQSANTRDGIVADFPSPSAPAASLPNGAGGLFPSDVAA